MLHKQMMINFYTKTGMRGFGAATPEVTAHLKKLGITNKNIVLNPS